MGRRVNGTGSRRDSREGKGRVDLLLLGLPRALLALSKHFENGAKKYGDRNWEVGQPLSWYVDSGGRHLLRWCVGDDDEDHLIANIWNLVCMYETIARILDGTLPKSLDDIGLLEKSKKLPGPRLPRSKKRL